MKNQKRQALNRILKQAPSQSFSKLATHTDTLEQARKLCRAALAETHLVKVAHTLSKDLGAKKEDLAAAGLPIDLLQFFPNWRRGSRAGFKPRSFGLRPTPTGAGKPLGTLRLQLSHHPGYIPYALILIRDLLRNTDSSVPVIVMVNQGTDLAEMQTLINSFHPSARKRVRLIEGKANTAFAQDNARSARDQDGNPVMYIPRDFSKGKNRQDDALSETEAQRQYGVGAPS